MPCRSHSGAHSGFTGAPRGSGGKVHMNGRRSTRPSGSVSGDGDTRDCKPAGFVLSTPSGEGAAGDGGFLPKLSRRRFPSPFSLSRICSMRSGPSRRVRLCGGSRLRRSAAGARRQARERRAGGRIQRTCFRRVSKLYNACTTHISRFYERRPQGISRSEDLSLQATHTTQAGVACTGSGGVST